MRVQYLSIITGACRARVASTSVFTRVHPVQPDHPFWTKLFYRSTISVQLCNFGWTGWTEKNSEAIRLPSLKVKTRQPYQSTPNRIWRRFHASALSVLLTVRFREATKLEFRARGGRAPGGQVGHTGYIPTYHVVTVDICRRYCIV